MTNTNWRIIYPNKTEPNSGAFYGWWEVTDETLTFKCDSEDAARLLARLLSEGWYTGKPNVEHKLLDQKIIIDWGRGPSWSK